MISTKQVHPLIVPSWKITSNPMQNYGGRIDQSFASVAAQEPHGTKSHGLKCLGNAINLVETLLNPLHQYNKKLNRITIEATVRNRPQIFTAASNIRLKIFINRTKPETGPTPSYIFNCL